MQETHEMDPEGFPLKNPSLAQMEEVVLWLDAERPGWDRDFWVTDLQLASPDVGWDWIMPAVARVFPALLKKGFTPEPVPDIS
jgi:hypothetical protein